MTTPQVLITGSAQATVDITSADPPLVEVQAPAVPQLIELTVAGPQGPIGPIRQPDAFRVDTSTAGLVYTGKAPSASPENSPAWTIIRSTYSPAGVRLSKKSATGVTWTGRSSHTYS